MSGKRYWSCILLILCLLLAACGQRREDVEPSETTEQTQTEEYRTESEGTVCSTEETAANAAEVTVTEAMQTEPTQAQQHPGSSEDTQPSETTAPQATDPDTPETSDAATLPPNTENGIELPDIIWD